MKKSKFTEQQIALLFSKQKTVRRLRRYAGRWALLAARLPAESAITAG
jgi:hypothetical protein